MNLFLRFKEELNKPQSVLEKEQFRKVLLDCSELGIGYSVFFLIGCVALYGHVSTVYLVLGGCVMFVEAVVKLGFVSKFKKQNAEERSKTYWRKVLWFGALHSGVFFGLASLVLLLPLPQANLIVLAFAYLGVYITSCWLGCAYLPIAVAKLIPLTLPLAISIAWVGTPMYLLVSLALFFMTAMSLFYVKVIVRQHADLVYTKQCIEEISDNLKLEKLAAEKLVIDKSRFIASASHDLRQPLHALGLFHSAIRARSTDEKVLSVMDSVDKSTIALNHLFEGLLDLSRLDSGAIEAVFEHFSIDVMVASIQDEFLQMAQSKGLALEFKCDHCVVFSDMLLVEQIVRNLLGNAIKFTEKGAITLRAVRNGHLVSISVSDTGPGIDEADIDHIYNEFHQTERSKHHENKGFGLGLAIVSRITRLLGTPLNLSSVQPNGACFTLELPAGVEEQTQASIRPLVMGDSSLNAQVLVIDDNVNILDGMQALLCGWDIACLAASSRDEAIQYLDETGFVPELLICDYHLSPGSEGLGTAHSICDHVGHDIPIVIITGDTKIEIGNKHDMQGVEILYKPVRPDKLREVISRSLEVKDSKAL